MPSKAPIIIIIILGGAGVFSIAVPAIPVSYQESYEVSVPYDEQEPYTVQVPYQTMESKQQSLGSTSDRTLEGGYYIYWSPSISVGRDIEFSVSASDTVHLFVFTPTQYTKFTDTGAQTPNEKQLLEISSGKLGYHVSTYGTYYFVIYNPHDGFLGIGKKNVGIYSASIQAYWQEEVTKYRTETKYRTITKYRTETHYRTLEKRVTLLDAITGSYQTK